MPFGGVEHDAEVGVARSGGVEHHGRERRQASGLPAASGRTQGADWTAGSMGRGKTSAKRVLSEHQWWGSRRGRRIHRRPFVRNECVRDRILPAQSTCIWTGGNAEWAAGAGKLYPGS